MKRKAVFLDRDGTINVEKEYLCNKDQFEMISGAKDALLKLQAAGYLLIIITNQSGIARGYYSEEEYHDFTAWMLDMFEAEGIHISRVYHCPHHPEAAVPEYRIDCNCRKPKLGMFSQAIEDFDLDIDQCYAIGDKIRDCSICEHSGCKGFLIADTEKEEILDSVKASEVKNVEYAENLARAVDRIITKESNKYMGNITK